MILRITKHNKATKRLSTYNIIGSHQLIYKLDSTQAIFNVYKSLIGILYINVVVGVPSESEVEFLL